MLRATKWPDRWSIYWVIAGVLTGGIVHVVTVLSLPFVATSGAWSSFAGELPKNELRILAPASADNAPIPLMAPDVRYAVCKFDTGDQQVRFRTQLIGASWSIALYTPMGVNYYTISGAELQGSKIEMILTPAQESTASGNPSTGGAQANTVTVAVPQRQGLLLLRAPVTSPAYEPETTSVLKNSLCFSSTDK